jgi:hypothetical protein
MYTLDNRRRAGGGPAGEPPALRWEIERCQARGGGRIGGIARRRGATEKSATRSVDKVAISDAEGRNTAGSRARSGARNDDEGAASLRSIEQLFSQPACLRNGHEPDDWQQHAARASADISASDGNVIAAMINAVRNLRTRRL